MARSIYHWLAGRTDLHNGEFDFWANLYDALEQRLADEAEYERTGPWPKVYHLTMPVADNG